MNLQYKTDRLPLNFIALGYMFLAIGAWRLFVSDWKGIIFLVLSVFLIFLRSGVIIDTDRKMLKKYTGIFPVKVGDWEDIQRLQGLQIIKTKQSQTMNVLSLSRTDVTEVYKLLLNMPGRNIELMKGKKEDIQGKAETIASYFPGVVLSQSAAK